jgi:lysyl-tRNA synthetase class 2
MPPTTGIGPGLERMAMIFTEQEDIYDVIFFPMMKPHLTPVNRSIYGVEEEARVSQPVTELVMSLEEFRTLLVTASPVGRISVQAVERKAGALATIHSIVRGMAEGAVIAVSAQPADVTGALQARFPDLPFAI